MRVCRCGIKYYGYYRGVYTAASREGGGGGGDGRSPGLR